MGYLYRPRLRSGKECRYWWAKYYVNGKPVRESTGAVTKREAKRFLDQREGEKAKGTPLPLRVERIMYAELAGDLRLHYQTTGSRNMEEAEYRLKHLDLFFRPCRAVQIGPCLVTAYVAQRQEQKASNGTVNRELALLRRMLTLAYRNGKLLRVPPFEMLKEAPPRQGFFEREQFEKVMEHLPAYLRPAVTFAYLTGWRKAEVLGLTWQQVDFNAGVIRLDPGRTKGGEGRVFPLFSELEATLLTLQRVEGCPWVFHRNGQPVRDYYRAWRTACNKAGLSGRIFHDFRRTAVRNMLRAGLQERHAMALVGHRTRSMLDRYNIVVERDLTEAGRKLAGTFWAHSEQRVSAAQVVNGE